MDTADFVLSPDSPGAGSIASLTGSGDTYQVTVSASADGTYNLDLVSSGHEIADTASNPLADTAPTGADHTYTVSTIPVDTTFPTVSSIERHDPASENTDSQTLIYRVTFSENVTGVDTADFVLSPDSPGAGSIASLTGSGDTYQVTVSASADGTYNLDLVSSGHEIADTASNPLADTAPTGADHTYTVSTIPVDTTFPTVSSIERHDPASENTDSQTLIYRVTFSENVTGVDTADFVLSPDSPGAGSIASLTGSGDTYHVTVSASADGTYNLDLVSSGHEIADTASNPLADTAPTGADHTYTVSTIPVDTTFPTVSSIERHDPASENTDSQTLIYRVTFSENVTGVDAADFALSPGSTGGGTSTSGQFTQTRSPALAITEDNTVSDTMTVTGSDTATSVSVAIDITHTYIGDLKVDLIAPDGTTKTLHNRSGGGTDDIDQTYAPNFDGVPIAGTWTLRVNDNYAAEDDGVLNSWTLTINHGSTASPVTTVSGSGSTYYATVSAAQDGTYNLDLVSSGHEIADTASNPLADTAPTGADHTYTVSTIPVDTTFPTVSSIERHDPASENTDSQTLIYRVTFSENVTGVDAADFALSPGSPGAGSIASLTGSGDTYHVTVSASADGTYNLDLVSSGHEIADTASNPLADTAPTGADHTYTVSTIPVDTTFPTVSSIERHDPASENTDSQTLVYRVTFSENVTGVDTADFVLSPDSPGAGSIASLTGSGDTYHVTVSASADGTYNLDLVSSGHEIADTASNPLADTAPTGADHTYTVSTIPVDTTFPTVSSIERHDPASENTDSQTLIYRVTFSENVTGVDAADFALSPGSTGGGTSTSGQFTQTRSPALAITEDNTVSDTIAVTDTGNATSVSVAIDITHTYIGDLKVDLIAPDGTTKTLHNRSGGGTDDIDQTYAPNFDGVPIAGTWTLRVNDNYAAADDGVLNSWTLTINHGSTASPVTTVSGSGSTYYATVSAAQDGTYNLDLVSSGHEIADTASNPLADTAPTGADHTYTVSTIPVDTTFPTVSSIERHDPASENTDSQTLIYRVTFSENVTGVDAADFALSPGSTGGGTSTSGQFTQTRSPALAITEDNTVSDTIAVTDTGNATSVSVAIDITHTYIGDLKVDLIAPDGTTKTLHNRSGGGTDDIDQTYAPNFDGVPIAGTWTLRVNDNYAAADDGVLNSWTLTINHGSSSTASPVTTVSGSGSTYYATVSAAQDGTYNLDLVSSGHEIADTASNPLADTTPTGADHTYTVSTIPVDTTFPTVSSIERHDPASENTDSQTLIYRVTFSENVTGVDAADFALSPGSTGGGTSTSGQFTQTRSPALAITQANTVSDTIAVTDTGNATSVSVAIDITHTYIGDLKVDLIAPDGTTKTLHNRSGGTTDDIDQTYAPNFDGVPIAGTWTLRVNDNYAAADDGVLNSWTLTINHGSSSTASPVTTVSGSGSTYYATVSAAQDGTYNLDLVSSGHEIADTASNPLADTTPTGADHTYTVSTIPVDTTFPTVSSIERHDPASENTDSQTLIYRVTFSENVTGVDAADFALSPGSTGGGTSTSGQFTQTRSPALAITQANTVSDTIAVTDTGNATSVSVAIDITHTYIGDLKVDLIAPDGTTKTLHNRSGGTTDDIDQTYAPNFDGVPIAGTWTLRVNDNYAAADDGVLNSWTLTINHGSSSTASPVTTVSGSGSTYYATVSAAQDGTYNLDLVSSGHEIADTASNPLADTTPTGADHTYTVSTTVADVTDPVITVSGDTQVTVQVDVAYSDAGADCVDNVDPDPTLAVSNPVDTSTAGTYTVTYTCTDASGNDATATRAVAVEAPVQDTASPTVTSIARSDPAVEVTNRTSLVFQIAFSEDVTDVDASDFVLSPDSTGTGSVTGLAGSGSAYSATVAVTADGTFNLDIAAGHGIIDSSGTGLADTAPLTDHTYTVNRTAPTFTPIEMIYPADEIDDSNDCSTGLNGTHTITLSESDDITNSTVAVYPRTVIRIDDSTANGPSLSDGDGFGSSVANIGDLDGDGTVDIAVGAWTSNGPEVQSGALHVIFMNADGTPKGTAEINSTATYAPYMSGGDTFGASVAGIGDLDGDGTVDIAVGAHNDDASGTNNGTVYVIFLNADGTPKSGTTAINGDTANGPDLSRGDNFGRSVANIEDLDGDGTVDIAVGAHHVDDPSGTGSGALHVIFMNADGTPKGTIEINGDTANGPSLSAGDRFGASVANIGDLDGDGTVDIAVGATRDDADNDVDSGALHVIFMNADGTPKGTIEINGDTANGPSLSGGDHFGRSVANIGDLDGDGTVDIAVGAYRDDENGTDSGALHVIFMNADGTPKGTIEINGDTANGPSLSAGDLFGSSIANIGDLDGDGTVDIAVGAHRDDTDDSTDSGAVHMIFLDTIATNGNCFMGAPGQDTAPPTVVSITRSDPAVEVTNSTSLVFQVIFSENVTDVDAGDFVLSPDSTGEGGASGQFAQTSEPAAPIPDRGTIQDAIAVEQPGTATSVSVAVDITHSYIGDLVIDLIAPDGTTRTLHDRTGYETDDIDQTYAPDFGGVGIEGDWTLRVRDGAGGDTGTLNGWTLTINHGSTADTTNPVTSVSGSGDTYLVTVSASTDGTYNLDLASGHSIADEASNPLADTAPTGADHTYIVSTVVV